MVRRNTFWCRCQETIKMKIENEASRIMNTIEDFTNNPNTTRMEAVCSGECEAAESVLQSVVHKFQEVLGIPFVMTESGNGMYAGVSFDSGVQKYKYLQLIDLEENESVRVRTFLVSSSAKELLSVFAASSSGYCERLEVQEDKENPGEFYITTSGMENILKKCEDGRGWSLQDAKAYMEEIVNWTCQAGELRSDVNVEDQKQVSREYKKYEYAKGSCKRCEKIILSDRAYTSILAEALSRDPLETGGILLGYYEDDVWYVVEATDPGIKTFHNTVHHEMDEVYHNHVYPVLSRLYKQDLMLIGLWHRHPGDYNRFSADDNQTNESYADAIDNGTLSFLINFMPETSLTCYYYDQKETKAYYQPELLIGDSWFEGTDFLKLASPEILEARKGQMQREIKQSNCNHEK